MLKEFFNGEVKWGPASWLLGLLTVLWVAIFIWQLVSTGDPAEAGTRTAAIMTVLFGGLLALGRMWQARNTVKADSVE